MGLIVVCLVCYDVLVDCSSSYGDLGVLDCGWCLLFGLIIVLLGLC